MDSKTILLILTVMSTILIGVTNAGSPLQFSGRSLLSKDQRAALLKLVQGPNAKTTTIKKSQTVEPTPQWVEPKDANEVQSRIAVTDDADDGQLDSEGCMKKVVMVEEVEFDTEIKCQHVSQESCFESYTTTFKKTKTEECDESFKKECEIEYFKIPKEEKVQICNEMLNRDCGVEGPEICSKEYETICETKYVEHEVKEQVPNCETLLVEKCMTDDLGEEWCDNIPQRKCTLQDKTNVKLTPKTECQKKEAQVCGPETCPIVKGERICKDEIKTVIHEVPQESCNMVPRKICNIVSKVVPTLEPVKHCIDIPKEMCAKSRINPVRKTKPVVRKWCLNANKIDLENTIYALSEVEPYEDETFKLEAQLIDANTGVTLCKKEFTPSPTSFNQRPIELAFALLGEQRNLVSCGHENAACKVIDIGNEEPTTFRGVGGPGQFSASFLDSAVSDMWLTVGGLSDSGDPDIQIRAISLDADFKSGSRFVVSDFPDLGDATGEALGRGCLLKFAGPDDEPVTFYLAERDIGDGPAYSVKHGTSIATRTDGLSAFELGQQPICGYAVRTKDSSSGEQKTGDTVVYFMARMYTGQINHYILNIPTSSSDAMNTFFSSNAVNGPSFVPSDFLSEIEDSSIEYTDGEHGHKATTVWMGNNRSMMIVSSSKQVIQFDANTESFERLDLDEDLVEERQSMLMTVRATQADIENLKCA